MTTLKAVGLVGSHRGKAGGFFLARDPETISVAEVLKVTEGPAGLSPCLGVEQCDEAGCPTPGGSAKRVACWMAFSAEYQSRTLRAGRVRHSKPEISAFCLGLQEKNKYDA